MPRVNWSIKKVFYLLLASIPFLLISYYLSIDTRNVRGNWDAIWVIYLLTGLYYLFQKEPPKDDYIRTRSYLSPQERAEWKTLQKERNEIKQKPATAIHATRFDPSLLLIFIPSIITIILVIFTPNIEPPLILSVVFPLVLLDIGLVSLYNKRLIDNVPTSKTLGAFIGHVELSGTAESENPLTSYVSGTKCVHYSWSVSEKLYTGDWITINQGGESSIFYLKDDTGVIRIDPKNALLITSTILNPDTSQNDNLPYGPSTGVNYSDRIRRVRENIIPLHASIYVIGHARERQDKVAVEIASDEDDPVYIISTQGEKRASQDYWDRFTFITKVGFLIAIILPWLSISGRQSNPLSFAPSTITELNPSLCFVPGLLFGVVLAFGWALVIFNGLINLRNNVDQAWSLIDIQLKRRSDLIPNLVQILEGYREYEAEIQTQIAELKSQTLNLENPTGVAPLVQSVGEAYPELKAGQHFLEFQRALEETEQRIALARDYYNSQTRFYNTRLVMMPDMYVADLAGLQPRQYWGAESFQRPHENIHLVS